VRTLAGFGSGRGSTELSFVSSIAENSAIVDFDSRDSDMTVVGKLTRATPASAARCLASVRDG
jgi:hypothetical protein